MACKDCHMVVYVLEPSLAQNFARDRENATKFRDLIFAPAKLRESLKKRLPRISESNFVELSFCTYSQPSVSSRTKHESHRASFALLSHNYSSNTNLHLRCNSHWPLKRNHFSVQRLHSHDGLTSFIKSNVMNSSKEFLQVWLDHQWIGGLAKDFQQVIVTDKVEPREKGALFLLSW